MILLRDKIVGMFLGVAIGDALGMPVETFTFDQIEKEYGRITTYLDPPATHKWYGGKLQAGMWTDDTQLTLAIAKSLIEKGEIDLDDIAAKHVQAMRDTAIGWGGSTIKSVRRIESGVHWSMSGNPGGAGNGVAMKIAPIGAFLSVDSPKQLFRLKSFDESYATREDYGANMIERIKSIALMTHGSRLGVVSGLVQSVLIAQNLNDADPGLIFSDSFNEESLGINDDNKDNLLERMNFVSGNIVALTRMSVSELAETFGGATCYVYNSLPFSMACFARNPCRINSLYDAVNAGGDTDSNASIVGALIGSLNGTSIFPQHLIDGLWRKDEILQVANDFCDKFEIR